MQKVKKLAALLLCLCMVFSIAACGGTPSGSGTESGSGSQSGNGSQSGGGSQSGSGSGSGSGSAPVGEGVVPPIQPDAAGVAAKWSEKKTADGWTLVDNGDGETLGYSSKSGVSIIQVDGYAFKDLDKDGELDGYEDWRNSDEVRAKDLSAQMSVEEILPLYSHDGWMSFGATVDETSNDYDYLMAGGRAGVTRSASTQGNTTMAVDWNNALQAFCEANGNWGIPATISVDPSNIGNTIDQTGLAATMNVELAFELGKLTAKQYRAVGITMLLGPQIDITTTPEWSRSSGTYGEDPALNRDLADAFISGLQSTWAEDGSDLGWGQDSVYAIAKHYAGAGASEGGRNDHAEEGKYTIFPGNDFGAHLVPFLDGAFSLTKSVTKASGVMPNYDIAYSRDGSLGEGVGGAYSAYKLGFLREMDYQGFILTDWDITRDTDDNGKPWGVEDLTVSERFAKLMKNGVHQVGNTSNLEAIADAYDLLVDELGEDEATAIIRNAAYHFLLTQMQCQLFDNAYISLEHAQETVYTAETDAIALQQQYQIVIMLKNDGTIAQSDGSKKTVYIPMEFSSGSSGGSGDSSGGGSGGGGSAEPKWEAVMDLTVARRYFNVITDTVLDPTGTDSEGKAVLTENDIQRASAEDLAKCDMVLVPMSAPNQTSAKDSDGKWLPSSLQYGEYTATTARRESVAGNVTKEIINDGYGTKEQTVKENRSYANNTVGRASNYSDLELLQQMNSAVPESCSVVVLMTGAAPMVWSEVEPLADVIFFYAGSAGFGGKWFFDEAIFDILSGKVEPSALLPWQQPADMAAVEAQKEDVPRDMKCYVDAAGNTYDFAFGLNWSGVINDDRVKTYSAAPLTEPTAVAFHYAEE